MKDIILDVLKHTAGLGKFESIRVESSDTATHFLAMNPEKTFILNATTHEPIGIESEFGMGNIAYLNQLANLSWFRHQDSTVEINFTTRNDQEVPETINYKGPDGSESSYRLMHSSQIEPVQKFKGSKDIWNITLAPSKDKISQFAAFAGIYTSFDTHFIAKTDGDNLLFYFGDPDAASHKAQMIFAKDVKGEIKELLRWPIDITLSILKLSETGTSVIRVSDQGVINVEIDSGLATYNFYIIASRR